jgi:hypothetical protein
MTSKLLCVIANCYYTLLSAVQVTRNPKPELSTQLQLSRFQFYEKEKWKNGKQVFIIFVIINI